VPNQPAGVFWAVVNRLLIIFQVIFLVLSEVGWPMSFFDRFFPVLLFTFAHRALWLKSNANRPCDGLRGVFLAPIIVASWTDGKGLQN